MAQRLVLPQVLQMVMAFTLFLQLFQEFMLYGLVQMIFIAPGIIHLLDTM